MYSFEHRAPLSQNRARHPAEILPDDRGCKYNSAAIIFASHRGQYPPYLYSHTRLITSGINRLNGAPDRTRTCNLRLSLPTTAFAAIERIKYAPRLGSGLYLHRFRWNTYSLYGSRKYSAPTVITDRNNPSAPHRFPRYCHRPPPEPELRQMPEGFTDTVSCTEQVFVSPFRLLF